MPSSSSTPSSNWFVRFHNGHEKVKNAVHSYWRQNTILSPRGPVGKVVMSCFYFSLPVMFGYVVVNKIVEGSESTIQEKVGDKKTIAAAAAAAPSQKIGAGGWGGGVNLATSDKATHDVNRINLERFLKKQRKLKQKREREAAAAATATAERG